MDWTEDAIARLRALWDEGHSTAEIGRRMSVSKNAVVGKAHRLNLPARPSPIRRDVSGTARPVAPRRVTGPTLPPLNAEQVVEREVVVVAPVAPVAPPVVAPRPVAVAPVRAPIPAALRAVPVSRGRNPSCCWPIGEPGTKSFRFCDAEAMSTKPYCNEHAQLAYVKVRDRRDEAAA
jgi:GcrA cell cycle regulator